MLPFLLLFGLFAMTAVVPQSGSTPEVATVSVILEEEHVGGLSIAGSLEEPEARQSVRRNYAHGTGVIAIPLTPPDPQGRSRLLEPLPPYAIIGKGAGLILETAPRRPERAIARP